MFECTVSDVNSNYHDETLVKITDECDTPVLDRYVTDVLSINDEPQKLADAHQCRTSDKLEDKFKTNNNQSGNISDVNKLDNQFDDKSCLNTDDRSDAKQDLDVNNTDVDNIYIEVVDDNENTVRREIPKFDGVYIEGALQGVEVSITLDTGATSSLVSRRIFYSRWSKYSGEGNI